LLQLNVVRVGKKGRPSANGKIGSGRTPILSGPRVNGFEENSVCFEQIGIEKLPAPRETLKGGINAGHERRMLQVPDDLGVFSLARLRK
jgi:hypothetical protein